MNRLQASRTELPASPVFFSFLRAAAHFFISVPKAAYLSAQVVIALGSAIRPVLALPLESFTAPLSVTCGEGSRECGGVLRVHDALGRHTGISIIKSPGGEVSVQSGKPAGSLHVEAEGAHDVTVVFSWDGDSNPDVLSGSGLNCFDLTRQGAYAFVVSAMTVESECVEQEIGAECPHFTIHSRVYDSQDPTGQRFSASTITRGAMDGSEVVIPFSNFVRSGPRGKGSFTCAGAVTIAIKFSGLEELEVELGPIYSNGAEGLTPLPTVTVPSITPDPTSTVVVTQSEAVAAIATPLQQTPLPSPTAGAPAFSPDIEGGSVQPTADQVQVTPKTTKVPRALQNSYDPPEAVYGSVVFGQ